MDHTESQLAEFLIDFFNEAPELFSEVARAKTEPLSEEVCADFLVEFFCEDPDLFGELVQATAPLAAAQSKTHTTATLDDQLACEHSPFTSSLQYLVSRGQAYLHDTTTNNLYLLCGQQRVMITRGEDRSDIFSHARRIDKESALELALKILDDPWSIANNT
jgi:hypothetical protein